MFVVRIRLQPRLLRRNELPVQALPLHRMVASRTGTPDPDSFLRSRALLICRTALVSDSLNSPGPPPLTGNRRLTGNRLPGSPADCRSKVVPKQTSSRAFGPLS